MNGTFATKLLTVSTLKLDCGVPILTGTIVSSLVPIKFERFTYKLRYIRNIPSSMLSGDLIKEHMKTPCVVLSGVVSLHFLKKRYQYKH